MVQPQRINIESATSAHSGERREPRHVNITEQANRPNSPKRERQRHLLRDRILTQHKQTLRERLARSMQRPEDISSIAFDRQQQLRELIQDRHSDIDAYRDVQGTPPQALTEGRALREQQIKLDLDQLNTWQAKEAAARRATGRPIETAIALAEQEYEEARLEYSDLEDIDAELFAATDLIRHERELGFLQTMRTMSEEGRLHYAEILREDLRGEIAHYQDEDASSETPQARHVKTSSNQRPDRVPTPTATESPMRLERAAIIDQIKGAQRRIEETVGGAFWRRWTDKSVLATKRRIEQLQSELAELNTRIAGEELHPFFDEITAMNEQSPESIDVVPQNAQHAKRLRQASTLASKTGNSAAIENPSERTARFLQAQRELKAAEQERAGLSRWPWKDRAQKDIIDRHIEDIQQRIKDIKSE